MQPDIRRHIGPVQPPDAVGLPIPSDPEVVATDKFLADYKVKTASLIQTMKGGLNAADTSP